MGLLEDHEGLIQWLARSMRTTSVVGVDDLCQAGRIAFVMHAPRYDASRGVPFVNFITPHVRGAMLEELRRNYRLRGIDRDAEPAEAAPARAEDRADRLAMERDAEDAAFRFMCEEEREMARLYYVERLTLKEIAARFNCSQARICQRFVARIYTGVGLGMKRYQ